MKKPTCYPVLTGLALALALAAFVPGARANVFASDIKLNGSLTGGIAPIGSPVTISYILNEPATLGATIQILSGATVVDTISISAGSAGSLRGLNAVPWGGTNSLGAPVPLGTYSVSITSAAIGYTNWTQTSIDTNSGMAANYPLGIAVDNNNNSPYYGRVIMGCATIGSNTNVPAAAKKVGLFKMNADGSQADEGWYGDAGYTSDDAGDAPTAGQTPNSGGYDPMKIRIGDDDRIYWVDNSNLGAIIAADVLATTNQIVLNEANYLSSNPDHGLLIYGFQEFDVTATTTTNAAVWLCDNDYHNWGIWMYRITNGVADPNDQGSKVVETDYGDLSLVSSGGCTVDDNLDVFVGQDRFSENAVYDAMVFTNWNGGQLPPESSGYTFMTGTAPDQVAWGYGCDVDTQCTSNPTFEDVRDVVINRRQNPTLMACPMVYGNTNDTSSTNLIGRGIRLLNVADGSLVSVTNGASVQVLTNLDWGNGYSCAAWDKVGNLYAASPTTNLWRVWSPPGTNSATTVALGQLTLVPPPTITSIAVSGASVTIKFTEPPSASASAFTLYSSAAVTGPYALVGSATITAGSPAGNFQAVTATSGSAQFYRVYGP